MWIVYLMYFFCAAIFCYGLSDLYLILTGHYCIGTLTFKGLDLGELCGISAYAMMFAKFLISFFFYLSLGPTKNKKGP